MTHYYKIKLDEEQYRKLMWYLQDNNQELYEMIKENKEMVHIYGSKVRRTQKATKAKIEKSKEKIRNAINLLKMEGKEITAYAVAKTAGISYNTAKKYLEQIKL